MRKTILVGMLVILGICLWLLTRDRTQSLSVRTSFQNADGLRAGAHVRVDGVDLGQVKEVRVGGRSGKQGVEVRMVLRAPYALAIPSDSVASLQTDGVLGPTFVEIDTSKANGPPIDQNGLLTSAGTADNEAAARALEVIGNAMLNESHKLRQQDQTQAPAATAPKRQ